MTTRVVDAVRRLRSSSLAAGGGFLLFAALTVVNLSSFLFHVVVSRHVSPANYGALGALLGVLLVLGVPAAALQVTITKAVASRRQNIDEEVTPIVIGPLLAQAVIWGVVGGAILALLAPFARSFLHLPSVKDALMLSAYVVPLAIGLVPKAVLLGEQRFRLLSVGLIAGAVTRVILSYVFVRTGHDITGALGATVLGEVVTAVILLPSLRTLMPVAELVRPLTVRWRDARSAIAAFSGFWVLSGVDTLLARHFLAGSASGFYAAASTAAGAAMFLPGAVAIIAFPSFAKEKGLGPKARQSLMEALGVVLVLSVGAAAVVSIVPGTIVRFVFGSAYLPSTAVVGMLAIAAAAIGLVSVLMNFHIARGTSIAASACWLGVAVAAVGISLFHSSATSIATVIVVADALVLSAMAATAFRRDPRREPVAERWVGRELWDLSEPDLDVSIVVPFYNPGEKLRTNVERLLAVLESAEVTYEVVAVSDGSTDGSDLALMELEHPALRHVQLAQNYGKGEALRVGLATGHGRYLGFIDADGDIDPGLFAQFLQLVRLYQPDIVLGSKRHPMSEVEYPRIRRIYSWSYQQLIRLLFHLDIKDSQTGLKLIRREVLADVLPRMLEKRFAFDLELFVVARHLGYRRLFEAPVRIEHQFTSTISLRAVRGMILDTMAIFYRLRFLRYYDRPVLTPTAVAIVDQSAIVAASRSAGRDATQPPA